MYYQPPAGRRGPRSVLMESPTRKQGAITVLGGVVVALIACTSSNPGYGSSINMARLQFGGSTNPVVARQEDVDRSVAEEISQIKMLAGLTWLQLAKLLGVSRRTIHGWADGGEPSARNFAEVHSLLERVKTLVGLPIFRIRNTLLNEAGIATSRVPEPVASPVSVTDPTPIKYRHAVQPRRSSKSSG
jgi:hypothetical protein